MKQVETASVLSISYYGSGLAERAHYSGALDRQRDYARFTKRYHAIVPGPRTVLEPVVTEGGLAIYTVAAANPILWSFRAYRRARALHQSEAYDILMVDNPHIGGILGVVLKSRLKIPLVVHSMADMLENPWYRRERFTNYIKELLARISFQRATVYRVSTDHEVKRLTALGYSTSKLAMIPFYIDQDAFAMRLRATTVTREQDRVLYVGRFGLQKDMPTLIRAFAGVIKAHPQARLALVGNGPILESCKLLAASLGISGSVEFQGSIPYDQVPREYMRASLFVLPSLYEGTCMVLHEAALAKLPIISTENAGAVDFITQTGEEGWLVPVQESEALAHALITALSLQGLALHGEATYRRLERFTKERALTAYREMLENILFHSSTPQ